MSSIFNIKTNSNTNTFTTGISVTGGAVVDALTVNGVAITSGGGGGGSTPLDTGLVSGGPVAGVWGYQIANNTSLHNSNTTAAATALTYKMLGVVDTLGNAQTTIANNTTANTADIVELQLIVDQLAGFTGTSSLANASYTTATAITDALGVGAANSTALQKSGGTMSGALIINNTLTANGGFFQSAGGVTNTINGITISLGNANTIMQLNGTVNINGSPYIPLQLLDLSANTAPTSISKTQAATANSLTNVYNMLNTMGNNMGYISGTNSTTVSIGTGSGSGLATINIANGTNTGVNNVSIGNASTVVNLNGTVNVNGVAYNAGGGSTDTTLSTNIGTSGSLATSTVLTLGNLTKTLTTVQGSTTSVLANGTGSINIGNNSGYSGTVNVGTSPSTATVSIGSSGGNLSLQGITNPIALQLAFSDETTALTTSNSVTVRAPFAFNVRSGAVPLFMLNTVGTAGTTTFDILKNGQTIYGTKPSISFNAAPSNAQFTNGGAGNVAGVLTINPTPFNQYDKIQVIITSAGTGMTGSKCIITAS